MEYRQSPFRSRSLTLELGFSNFFGHRLEYQSRLVGLGIREAITAPRSPWQNAYAERVIGSIRRECLNHVIVLGERHLRWLLRGYFRYYHGFRTHLSLGKDAPDSRQIQAVDSGRIVELPDVGGLHHHYERRAA